VSRPKSVRPKKPAKKARKKLTAKQRKERRREQSRAYRARKRAEAELAEAKRLERNARARVRRAERKAEQARQEEARARKRERDKLRRREKREAERKLRDAERLKRQKAKEALARKRKAEREARLSKQRERRAKERQAEIDRLKTLKALPRKRELMRKVLQEAKLAVTVPAKVRSFELADGSIDSEVSLDVRGLSIEQVQHQMASISRALGDTNIFETPGFWVTTGIKIDDEIADSPTMAMGQTAWTYPMASTDGNQAMLTMNYTILEAMKDFLTPQGQLESLRVRLYHTKSNYRPGRPLR
jgi:hypothetical protein